MELPQLNQSPVVFNAETHTYKLGDRYLKGVTSTLVRRAYPHTYDTPEGMSEEVWKEKLRFAASNGTAIHQAIELYEDLGVLSDTPEVQNYIKVKEDNGFVNLATEYIVSDEKNYASAVDHVWLSVENSEIVLIDIKRTSEVHYPDVTCQLSIYKKFFEGQNKHLLDKYRISIAVLWLRKDKVEFTILKPLQEEIIDDLIAADLKDETFDIVKHFGDLPTKFADAEEQIAMLQQEIKEKKALYDEMTSGLLELMCKYNVEKFSGKKIMLTVTKGSKREAFDKDCFKADHPELYEEYKTYTDVKPSLRITIKKQ